MCIYMPQIKDVKGDPRTGFYWIGDKIYTYEEYQAMKKPRMPKRRTPKPPKTPKPRKRGTIVY